MLQFALLLLGCALSRYLWDLQRTVSGVAVGITSLGILFYILIFVAGALYTSCPYQTPGSQIIRHVWDKTLSSTVARFSGLSRRFINLNHLLRPTRTNDGTSRALNANGHSGPEPTSYILDSDCISWILETPFSQTTHIAALDFLATLPFFQRTNPAVIIHCFDILMRCIDMGNSGWVAVIPGSESLAVAAATALLHVLVQLHEAGSGSLGELRRRYRSRLPEDIVYAQPSPITMTVLHFCMHDMLHQKFPVRPRAVECSRLGYEVVSRALVTHSKQQRRVSGKVPRWILRFVLDTLIQPVVLPDAVISNCFRIVSEDLGGSVATDER